MDLRFGVFVVIFLIAAFIWQSTNGKDSGGLSLISVTIAKNNYRLFCVLKIIVVMVIVIINFKNFEENAGYIYRLWVIYLYY